MGRHAANKTTKENVAKYNEEVGLHPVREKVHKKDRLVISITEEELKKGIEEDEADGCEAEMDAYDLADKRDSLSDCLFLLGFHLFFKVKDYVKLKLHLLWTEAYV